MNIDDADLRAAEYVLGTLADEDRQEFVRALEEDPALRKQVEKWEDHLMPMLSQTAEIEPSDGLWPRIEAEIFSRELPGVYTQRKSENDWRPFLPGIDRCVLHADQNEGVQSYLLRLSPGASIPPHDHRVAEDCLLIEGSVRVAGETLGAGDFQRLAANTRHHEIYSESGAVIFVRGEIQGETGPTLARLIKRASAYFGR